MFMALVIRKEIIYCIGVHLVIFLKLCVNQVAFDVKPEYEYFRITVRDERGNVACTNAYFPEDYL